MRPKQWTKNGVILAPIIFAEKAADVVLLADALAATALFCLLSSGTYIVNDLFDRASDRNHPVKSRRPIIKGTLSPVTAWVAAGMLIASSLAGAFALNRTFGVMALSYLALSVLYTCVLKKMVIIDVMTIAFCFVLRVGGGAAVAGVGISNWLFLCTVLLALFLGFAKRRHELLLLEDRAHEHRAILNEYSPYFLDQLMSVVTSSTVIAYTLYTLSPEVAQKLGTPYLPLTVPFVLYGIFRYLYLVHQKDEGGSPSTLMLSDRPLMVNIALWCLTVIGLLYVARKP